MSNVKAVPCQICSELNQVNEGEIVVCQRCGHKDHRFLVRSNLLCMTYALTALILYFPANIFPFMTIELYGRQNTTTIIGGIRSLMDEGSYPIAIIVFLASVLIPLVKLFILLFLSATARTGRNSAMKMKLYRFVEAIGRWSMLDIFLLAILVAAVKLGNWTHVNPEKGSLLFALVVIFSIMSSAHFDPRILWEKQYETDDSE